MYYNASKEELENLPIKNLKKMEKEIKFELSNDPSEEDDEKREFLSLLKDVIETKEEIVNEDAAGGSGGDAGGGTAYATSTNVAGMGSVVSAQPSSQAGAVATGDGTEGSGDIGVPLYTYSKDSAGKTGNKALKMGKTKGRKNRKLTNALAEFVKKYKNKNGGKLSGKTSDGKLMNFQDFMKDETKKVTKVKESNNTKEIEISDLKKGDLVKKDGSNIELKVIEVGNDWRSGKDYVELYNDVTDNTQKLVDISGYSLVKEPNK